MSIAAQASRLALKTRSTTPPKATRTTQSAAPRVASQGERAVVVVVGSVAATGLRGRCIQSCVPSVARTPKYPSSPAVTGQCTAAIAITRINPADTRHIIGNTTAHKKPRQYLSGPFMCIFFEKCRQNAGRDVLFRSSISAQCSLSCSNNKMKCVGVTSWSLVEWCQLAPFYCRERRDERMSPRSGAGPA